MIVSLLTPSQPALIDSNHIRVRASSHRFRLFAPYPTPDSEPHTSPDLDHFITEEEGQISTHGAMLRLKAALRLVPEDQLDFPLQVFFREKTKDGCALGEIPGR